MLTSIPVRRAELLGQRPAGADGDVHFCESLAQAVVECFSAPGDLVLDPFAGYGTTLVVAQRLHRRALGVELLAERADLVRHRLGDGAAVITGDVRRVLDRVPAGVTLCLTSPPYMTATDHPQNPLTGYRTMDGDYAAYLRELAGVLTAVASRLLPGGHLVVNAADLHGPGGTTPLARDLTRALTGRLRLRGTIGVAWDVPPEGIADDVCLVFGAPR